MDTADSRPGPAKERGQAALPVGDAELLRRLTVLQRQAAMGQLAGGMAREFNNLLTIILAQTQTLIPQLPRDAAAYRQAGDVIRAGRRAASLTRLLLHLDHSGQTLAGAVDVGQAVNGLLPVLERLLPTGIRLELSLAPDTGAAMCDEAGLELVLLNLVQNAIEAMPLGGLVTITLHAAAPPPGLSGPVLELTVRDTGCGISPEVRARLFEPFVTTKHPQAGVGLGLAVSAGIVRGWGGQIAVAEGETPGTAIRVSLRQVPGSAEPGLAGLVGQPRPRILVVDDDDRVRGMIAECLDAEGYMVMTVAGAARALFLVESAGEEFALVVADVKLPGLPGSDLVWRLRATCPDLRALFVSGMPAGELPPFGQVDGTAFLPKPFKLSQLTDAVRKLLAE